MNSATPAVRFQKALQALKSGRDLLRSGDADGACNRAYYAMFYAAHAALETSRLIEAGFVYKTHSGLIGAFGRDLVAPSLVDRALGRSLSQVYQVRLVADYAADLPDQSKAAWALEQAELFVTKMQQTFAVRN